jgi:HflK protein
VGEDGVNILIDFLAETISAFVRAAPYLLFGFFLAGAIKVLIPAGWLSAHLGRRNFRSVLKASLVGLPLPLCSCSVVPTAAGLRRSGASKGATVSFLVSTPETGVDSFSVSYALLDPILTVARPVVAFITALVAGTAVNATCGPDCEEEGKETPAPITDPCDCESETCGAPAPSRGLGAILRYGFHTLLDDLAPLLILGFLLTGLVSAILPAGALANPSFRGFPAMLLMLAIGIPLYVCATSSTPIAAAMIAKGLSPGAALVFLLSGPATNAASIVLLFKLLGRRVVMVYLIVIAVISLAAGIAVNAIYAAGGIDATAIVGKAGEIVPRWLETLSALVLIGLLAGSAVRTRFLLRWRENLRRLGRPLHIDLGGRAARAAGAAVLLVLYLLTGVSALAPGEVGWVVSFGKITRTVTTPGLVTHSPYPFARFLRERREQVRSIDRGYRQQQPLPPHALGGVNPVENRELNLEAEIATGEETLVSIRYGVQYRIQDAYAFRFRIDDPEQLVAAFAEHAIRVVLGGQATDGILIAHRAQLEDRVAAGLRRDLDSLQAGVEVLRVDFVDVHAPPEVHGAFRDVASALEDHERYIRQAESYRNSTVAAARAQSYRSRTEAEADSTTRVARAHGEAAGFTALEAASRKARPITRLRLYLDAAARVLPHARLILPLADLPLDLWVKLKGTANEWPEPPQLGGASSTAAPAPSSTSTAEPGTEGWREKLDRLQQSQQEKSR